MMRWIELYSSLKSCSLVLDKVLEGGKISYKCFVTALLKADSNHRQTNFTQDFFLIQHSQPKVLQTISLPFVKGNHPQITMSQWFCGIFEVPFNHKSSEEELLQQKGH